MSSIESLDSEVGGAPVDGDRTGGRVEVDRLIRGLREIPFAPSFGDVSTTLSHPTTTSHRGQTPEKWASQGINPGLVRLSIGLESAEDLWNDLAQALNVI